jgi:hypothetical protein
MENKTVVNAYICPTCGDIVYSRTIHDYRTCSCGDISVYEGFNNPKIKYISDKSPEHLMLFIESTLGELWNDWNYNENKFGIIKESSIVPNLVKKDIKDITGKINQDTIKNLSADELIEKINEIKNNHPDHKIKFNLGYDYCWDDHSVEDLYLEYMGYRLETDDEFEKRKQTILKNRFVILTNKALKLQHKQERAKKKEDDQIEKDKKKFQELKDKYGWN